MKAMVHLAWLVFVLTGSSACSEDPATSTKKAGKGEESLIKIGPDGSIETPQTKIDGQGNTVVPGLGGMKFAPNGDVFGSDGTKLFDGATRQWHPRVTMAEKKAASSAPSGGPGNPATGAADLVARLNTFTKGYNYRGHEFGKETVRKVGYEPSLGLLGITLDDVEETAPLTALIPMREVTVAHETYSRGGDTTKGILLACKNQDCITVTADSFEAAANALRAGHGAKLSIAKRRNLFGFGCRPAQCQSIHQAIGDLAK